MIYHLNDHYNRVSNEANWSYIAVNVSEWEEGSTAHTVDRFGPDLTARRHCWLTFGVASAPSTRCGPDLATMVIVFVMACHM